MISKLSHDGKRKHDCFDYLDKAMRKGRAKYLCPICKKDVSMAWVLYMMAIHELDD